VSDTKPAEVEYEERTQTELDGLRKQFQKPGSFAGANYVAPPAPGHDVKGLWHSFDSHGRTGYAAHAVGLHATLEAIGYQVQLIPHRNQDIDIEQFPKDRKELLLKWNKNAVGIPSLCILSRVPQEAWEMRELGPPIVPYCAFEGDVISDVVAQICRGEVFKQIWTVSPFVRDAFIRSGVPEKRVVALPPLLFGGPWEINEHWLLEGTGKKEPETFVFGTVGTWQKRKGLLDLVRAYFGAFKREDGVVLRVHTSPMSATETIKMFQERVLKDLAPIAAEFGDDDYPRSKKMPRIVLDLGTDKSDTELCRWIDNLDCYVAPSYGEGLGIPAVWAKGIGLPIVATGFGAVGDMIKESDVDRETVVPFKLAPVDPDMLRANAMFDLSTQWGVYEPFQFGTAMRIAFERGRVIDREGAQRVHWRHGLENVKKLVGDAVGALVDNAELLPKHA